MNSDQGKYLYTLYTHTQVHTLHFTYRSQITKEKPREYFDIKKKKNFVKSYNWIAKPQSGIVYWYFIYSISIVYW